MPIKDWNLKQTFDETYILRPAGRLRQDPRNSNIPNFVLHYNWYPLNKGISNSIDRLVQVLNIPTNSRIAVVGAGFAWSVEWLNANGYIAIPVDVSQYINDNYNSSEETEIATQLANSGLTVNTTAYDLADGQQKTLGDILLRPDAKRTSETIINENLSNNGSRRAVRNALGTMDYVITENMLSTLDDTELVDIAGRVESLRALDNAIVIHSDVWARGYGQDAGFNWKTGAEWRTFFNNTLNLPNHILFHSPTGEVA